MEQARTTIFASSAASTIQQRRKTTLPSSSSSLSRVRRMISSHWSFAYSSFVGWKRLLLADGPRQVINGLTLYSFYLAHKDKPGSFFDIDKYTNGSLITGALIFSTLSTVILFAGSAILLLLAGIFYIPLLCYIRGNLKVRIVGSLCPDFRFLHTIGILLPQSRQAYL